MIMEKAQDEKHSQSAQSMSDLLISIPRNVAMFDRLDEEELKTVAKYMNYRDVEPGDTVFKEGEKGAYMCFVAEGELEILKKNLDGESVVISTLQTGASIGEMAVIDNFPRSATVRAKSKGTLLTLSRYSFDTVLKQHPAIGIKLFQSLSRLLCLHLRKTSKGFADQLSRQKQQDES
jgi:CRP-like cAMP-binding protein